MMGPLGCPETWLKDHRSTLRKIPGERRAHQHRGGSLKPQSFSVFGNGKITNKMHIKFYFSI
jgi:hypothetical protein